MCPLAGEAAAKLAFRLIPGTMIPRQFGPRILMPSNFRCSCADQLLQLPALDADLAEAGRDDHDPPGAGLAALPHQRRDRGRRRAHHGQIGGVRQALDVFIGLDALHGLAFGIDRVNHAAKARSHQVPQYGVSDAARRCWRR